MDKDTTVTSTYVVNMPKKKRIYGDIDIAYDAMCENGALSIESQITECKLAIQKYIKIAADDKRSAGIREYANKSLKANLRELNRLYSLPRQKSLSNKLSIMEIKRRLKNGGMPVNIDMMDNYHLLERLKSLGIVDCVESRYVLIEVPQSIEKIVKGLQVGSIVQVYNDNRKAFMQTEYTITRIENRERGVWYHIENAVGHRLSPRQDNKLKLINAEEL